MAYRFILAIAFSIASVGVAQNQDELVAECAIPCRADQLKSCPSQCAIYYKPCSYVPYRENNIWLGVDALLLRVFENGFSRDFGSVSIVNTVLGTSSVTAITQKDVDINFDWDTGFRLNAGLELAPSGSELGGYWTCFHQKTKTTDGHNHAIWWLKFDTFDATYGHRFWMNLCSNFKPIVGLRYAQIRQNLNTDLSTPYDMNSMLTSISTISESQQKFWGSGPLLGIMADWYFYCGWSLYGSLDGGLLYGHVQTNHMSTDSHGAVSTRCNSRGSASSSQGVLDISLGIRWECTYVTLKGGLEHHRYSDFNQLCCSGNLNLFGANFGIEIHY